MSDGEYRPDIDRIIILMSLKHAMRCDMALNLIPMLSRYVDNYSQLDGGFVHSVDDIEELQHVLKTSSIVEQIMTILDPEEKLQKRLIYLESRTKDIRSRAENVKERWDAEYGSKNCDRL